MPNDEPIVFPNENELEEFPFCHSCGWHENGLCKRHAPTADAEGNARFPKVEKHDHCFSWSKASELVGTYATHARRAAWWVRHEEKMEPARERERVRKMREEEKTKATSKSK